jgi:hypothetical protein
MHYSKTSPATAETPVRSWLPIAALAALAFTALLTWLAYSAITRPDETESDRILRGSPPIPPVRQKITDNVLIISVDGLRPDLLLRGKTPNMHALVDRGSYTFWAQTTEVAITLPSHTSMITGVAPWKHGISWNEVKKPPVYPNYPTLMGVAKKYRPELTTALASGKVKFNAFTRGNSIDWLYLPPEGVSDGTVSDREVATHAAQIIDEHAPNILFVHFGNVDQIGHGRKTFFGSYVGGWGTDDQMNEIAKADSAIGLILDALNRRDLTARTLIILTADHGGQGRVHGRDDSRSRHIPWIAAGPHVIENLDLARYVTRTINTEDTFATASYFLGLPIAPDVDGRPVTQIIVPEAAELMHPPWEEPGD